MTTKNFVVKNGLTTGNIILDAGSSNITANVVVANLSVPATANLGAVGNVIITGGTSGQVLTTNGSGGLSWATTGASGAVVNSSFYFNEFTANGVQNAFTLSSTPDSVNQILVNYNGVLQNQGAYSLSGNVVTFNETPVNTAKIDVMVITGTAPANTVVSGSTGAIQFSNSGVLGSSTNLNFTTSNNTLSTANLILTGSANVAGNLSTTGWLSLQQATEKINTITGATGTVNHDVSTGAVFIHTGISANFTANLQNVPTTNSQVISVSLFLNQGSTPYYANAVNINGSAATLLWPSATAPTPTASRYETETFTLVRTSGGAWQVYGTYNSFG